MNTSISTRSTLAAPFAQLGPRLFSARQTAQGPWSPGYCHGGAPAALIAHAAEALPAATDMAVARVTIDLLRPVPTGELTIDAKLVREGRKLQLIDLDVHAGGVLVTRGQVLRLRREEQENITPIAETGFAGPDAGIQTRPPTPVGFSSLFDMRAVAGSFEAIGPSTIWFDMSGSLVEGLETSPVARALACADFANGIANVVPFSDWSYPSTDLTVSFARAPAGPWILVDAECWPGPEGRGITHARLGDRQGWFGRSLQTTIFERRPS